MTGTITKHKQKSGRISWGYYFRDGRDASGKWNQVTKQGFKTKTEADEALRDALKEAAAATAKPDTPVDTPVASPETPTFAQCFDAWISDYCEVECEPTTCEGYIKKGGYAKRIFGDVPINAITRQHISAGINTLRAHGGKKTAEFPEGKPLSVKTVREIRAVVSMTFDSAIEAGIITENLAVVRIKKKRRGQKASEKSKPKYKVLEKSQLEWFLAGVEGHNWLHLLLLLGAATGARRGEMLALRWSDIDFERSRLIVSKSLAQTRTKGVFLKCTKGGESREFSLPLIALQVLSDHRQKQAENRTMFGADYRSDLDLVFATPEGDYLKPDSVTAKVCLMARKLGFPKGVLLHTMRHTHGSHLLSHGVPLAAVSERLGHSDPGTTMRIYSHAIKRDDQLSSDTIGNTLLSDVGLNGMLGNARTKTVTN